VAAVRVLLFDVFGTLVDWRGPLVDVARGLTASRRPVAGADRAAGGDGAAGADWGAVVDEWRRGYQPALDRVRAGGDWVDLDTVHRGTLDAALAGHAVDLPGGDRERLVRAWRRLRPWGDVGPGLERLRQRHVTATLSNAHVALLVDLLRHTGLRVDAVLSAELARAYKPDDRVYLRALELLGCEPREAAMVACHPSDVRAAAALGLRPVFVRRPREWGPAGGEEVPLEVPDLLVVDGLGELADVLER